MKKNKLFLGVAFGFFTFLGIAMAATFSDITGHWAENDLMWAVNNGLLKGDEVAVDQEKTLRPNDSVTRAELVTILKRYDNLLKTGQNDSADIYKDSFKTTINGITWIGRESDGKYQAIKIDGGDNESVIYERSLNGIGDVKWNFSNDGKNLVIKGSDGGPEGAGHTEIGFIDAEEKIRSYYENYGSFESELAFEAPNFPKYNVSLLTTGVCEGNVPDSKDFVLPQFQLLGVEISSQNNVKTFKLDEPEMFDCPIVDRTLTKPEPQNIITHPSSISFNLPNGDTAWISPPEKDQEMTVSFYDY